MMTIIKGFCSDTNEIQRIPLDDEWVPFRVAKAVNLKVYVKVGPLNGFGAAHLHVQDAADGRVLHPRDAVVRQDNVTYIVRQLPYRI